MTPEVIIEALALPPDARVSHRVPKKLLVDNGAPTPQDKRILLDGIAELTWLASLRPSSIGVPAFRDPAREYAKSSCCPRRCVLMPKDRGFQC